MVPRIMHSNRIAVSSSLAPLLTRRTMIFSFIHFVTSTGPKMLNDIFSHDDGQHTKQESPLMMHGALVWKWRVFQVHLSTLSDIDFNTRDSPQQHLFQNITPSSAIVLGSFSWHYRTIHFFYCHLLTAIHFCVQVCADMYFHFSWP